MKYGLCLALLWPMLAEAREEEPALAFIVAHSPLLQAQRAVVAFYQPPISICRPPSIAGLARGCPGMVPMPSWNESVGRAHVIRASRIHFSSNISQRGSSPHLVLSSSFDSIMLDHRATASCKQHRARP